MSLDKRESLEISPELYEMVLELNPDAIVILQDGCYKYVNAAFSRMFGYSREEAVTGLSFFALVREQDVDVVRRRYEERLAGKDLPRTFQLDLLTKDGSLVPCETSAALVEFDGRPADLVVMRDISERRVAEKALLESNERFRVLFDHAQDYALILDPASGDPVIVDANEAACRIHGYSRDVLIGMSVSSLETPEQKPNVAERVSAVMSDGFATFETDHLRKDGTIFSVEVSACRINFGGKPLIFAIERDITNRRRLEEEQRQIDAKMQQAQKLEGLGLLSGGVAHDFNNLLTGILGNVDLAMMELSGSPPARTYLEGIGRSARQAAELTGQMLAYAGRGNITVKPVHFNEILTNMSQLLRSSLSKNLTFKMDLTENEQMVMADAVQVQQVMMNLIVNAAESIGEKEKGSIIVATGCLESGEQNFERAILNAVPAAERFCYFEVRDTGCGMDQATLERIFDPFFTTKFTGRGLGLAAVLGIVKAHKGALFVDSQPQEGTTFRILLPVVENRAAGARAGDAREDAGDWRGTGTILFVDDEYVVRDVGMHILDRAGFEVLVAENGRSGVDLFKKYRDRIRCVVLDLTMPVMSGEEAYTEIAKIDTKARVVMMSGFSEREVDGHFKGNRPVSLLQKPFRASELLAIIRELLETGDS